MKKVVFGVLATGFITLSSFTTVNDIKKQSVSCYPNPTNGILNFDFAGEQVP